MDLVDLDREDHANPNLIPPAVPSVWATGVTLGEAFDVLRTAFDGDVRNVPTDSEIAGQVGGVGDGDGHSMVSLDVA
jgi:hypothetical protein